MAPSLRISTVQSRPITASKGFSGRGESGIPKGRPGTDSMRIDSPGGGPCAERIPVRCECESLDLWRRERRPVGAAIRDLGIRHQTQLSLADVARRINPLLRGWIEYYGRYAPSALYPLLRYIYLTLRDWVMRKFKRFAASKSRAGYFLKRLARENANLFVLWRSGIT